MFMIIIIVVTPTLILLKKNTFWSFRYNSLGVVRLHLFDIDDGRFVKETEWKSHLFWDCPPLSAPREATQRQKFGGTPLPGAENDEQQKIIFGTIETGIGRLLKATQISPLEHMIMSMLNVSSDRSSWSCYVLKQSKGDFLSISLSPHPNTWCKSL